MMRSQRNHRRAKLSSGLSLLETSVSLGILAVGILGMLAAQTISLSETSKGRHSTEAAQVARDQLELIQRMPWSAPDVQPTAGWTAPRATTSYVDRAGGAPSVAEQTFNVSWWVQPGPIPELRRVDVRVQWAEDNAATGGINRTLVMSTLKADH